MSKKISMKKTLTVVAILVGLILLNSCYDHKKGDNSLTVFHAGSLSIPFKNIIAEYNKENPDVNFFAESSGSLDAARKITDLEKECDILAVADFQVIDKLVVPEFADWNFVFASNSMVIAYTDKSKYSSEFTSENWKEILKKEDVYIGRSDPNADPCGYRAIFVFKLVEKYFKEDER
jgi:molybdate/tungstate transport system substrate-binding protein